MPGSSTVFVTEGRLDHVCKSTHIWALTMIDKLSIEHVETFAKTAEKLAHDRSREYTQGIKDDEMALTEHAALMRTTSAKIVLLRDGIVPAWKIDKESPNLRQLAVETMGWIHADCQAMEIGLR